MTTDLFIVILENKCTAFAQTESRRLFDITDCDPITDSRYGINFNGVLPTAKQVSPEYVADLLMKGASLVFKKKKKRTNRITTSKSKAKARQLLREGGYIH